MNLALSDDAFIISGLSYPGFPIVLDDNDRIVEPAHWFLLYECLQRGRIASKHTWARLGQTLYDFFGYLNGAGTAWDHFPLSGEISQLASYRDWAFETCGLKASTINGRLRTLVRFYQWAQERKLIDALPFDFEMVSRRPTPGFLAHVELSDNHARSPDVMLREDKEPIKVLTKAQIRILLSNVKNPVHRLLVRQGLQTGLRSDELRSSNT